MELEALACYSVAQTTAANIESNEQNIQARDSGKLPHGAFHLPHKLTEVNEVDAAKYMIM